MRKTRQPARVNIASYAAPMLWALGLVFILAQSWNYSIYIPSTYRVIYIPVYFWAFCLVYLLWTHRAFLRKALPFFVYVKKSIFPLFCLHLYLLLGFLITHLFSDLGELSGIYFLYIKGIFLLATAAAIRASSRAISTDKEAGVHKPLIYAQFTAAAVYFFIYNILSGHFYFAALIACFALAGGMSNFIELSRLSHSIRRMSLSDTNVAAVIFILAFIVRAAFGVILVDKTAHSAYGPDGYLSASDDGDTYDGTANAILKDPSLLKKGRIELWGHWDQAYSIFLAGLYKLFGRSFYAVTCVQAFLGALVPVFIFLTGRMLFPRTVAIIASALLSFKGGLLLLSAYMGHEALWLPVLYFVIFLLTRYYINPASFGAFHDIAIGIALGVLVLTRSMYLYFLPFLCLWEILFFTGINAARKMSHLAIVVLTCMGIVFGTFHALNNKMSFVNKNKAEILWQFSRLEPPFQHLGNDRLEAFGINFYRDPGGSFRAIGSHPVRFIALAGRIYPLRVAAYLEAYQFGIFDPVYMVNPVKKENRFAPSMEFYFTLFFLAGLVGCFSKKGKASSPIFLTLAFHILFFCFAVFHPSPRLKEVSSPIIYLVGSFGFYNLFKSLTKRVAAADTRSG